MLEPGWPVNRDWLQGQSRPEQVNLRFYLSAGFMLVYLGVLVSIMLTNWVQVERALYRFVGSDFQVFEPLLVLPGMLLLGVFGLPRTVREFIRWRRDRQLVMTFDPVPAALDGELGGRLTIPLDIPANTPIGVTVSCMRRVVTRGQNASTRDELLWQTPAVVRRMRSVKGTRIEFIASLTPQQPETSFNGRERNVWWAVHVTAAEHALDAVFPVPVSGEAEKKRSDIRFSQQERLNAEDAARMPATSWHCDKTPGGHRVEYPSGRSGKAAGILILIGLIFSGVIAFMGYNIYQELSSERVSYFSLLVEGMILLGFGLFAPGLLIAGLYMRFNRMMLDITPDELITTRSILGASRQHRLSVTDVSGIAERVIGRMGQGVASELEYAVDAYTHDGQRIRLGDGIKGQQEVEQLLALLRRTTGVEHRPDPSEYRLQRRQAPAWVKWIPLLARVAGVLIFGLTVAAFVFEFI